MGTTTNASEPAKTLPPIRKTEFKNKDFYVTIIFSIFPRYDMLDPKDSVFQPEQVFDKPHLFHTLRWQDGEMKIWEPGKEKQVLKKQDKVFYIDCSSMLINPFKCSSPSSKEMAKKLIQVVSFIKDFLNLQYVKGYKGTVHFNLSGYIPVDPMVHSLRKLFDSKTPQKEYYKTFSGKIGKLFENSFERYTNSGYSFTVDYCCVFEGYCLHSRQISTEQLLLEKINELKIYKKELSLHNSKRDNKGERDESIGIKDGNEYSVELPHAHHKLESEVAFNEKQMGIEYFVYHKGRPSKTIPDGLWYNETRTILDDQIMFHGRPCYEDYFNKLLNFYVPLYNKEYKKSRKAEFDFWWDNSKARREEIEFQKFVEQNNAVHKEGDARIAHNEEGKRQIELQKDSSGDLAFTEAEKEYDLEKREEKLDELLSYNEAYEVGRKINEEDGTLKQYHDINKIEFDSEYVDSEKLEERNERYREAMRKSDKYTLQKEQEADDRMFWYPIEVCWAVLRIAVGIATFFNPIFIFVDIAMEVIQLGVKYGIKHEPFEWTDCIGIGIDLLCLWAIRGGSIHALFEGVKPEAKILGNGFAVEAANSARMKGGTAVVKTEELTSLTTKTYTNDRKAVAQSFEIAREESSAKFTETAMVDAAKKEMLEAERDLQHAENVLKNRFPTEYGEGSWKMEYLRERLATKTKNYDDIVKEAHGLRNHLGYLVYEGNTAKMTKISKFFEDGKLFYSNWNNLRASGKIAFASGVIMKDVIGNVWTGKGLYENAENVKDTDIDYTIYDVADNSLVLVQ